jgi:hypothetical protein
VTPRKDITTALNKEAAQRPGANNGGRRNENRRRISIGCADWLCNAKQFANALASLGFSALVSEQDLKKAEDVKQRTQV